MAQNAMITCPFGEWTELTNAAATGDVSLSLIDGAAALMATAGASEPAGTDGLPVLSHGDGWSEATIAEKFPGVASADRLWARPLHNEVVTRIYISHGA